MKAPDLGKPILNLVWLNAFISAQHSGVTAQYKKKTCKNSVGNSSTNQIWIKPKTITFLWWKTQSTDLKVPLGTESWFLHVKLSENIQRI